MVHIIKLVLWFLGAWFLIFGMLGFCSITVCARGSLTKHEWTETVLSREECEDKPRKGIRATSSNKLGYWGHFYKWNDCTGSNIEENLALVALKRFSANFLIYLSCFLLCFNSFFSSLLITYFHFSLGWKIRPRILLLLYMWFIFFEKKKMYLYVETLPSAKNILHFYMVNPMLNYTVTEMAAEISLSSLLY